MSRLLVPISLDALVVRPGDSPTTPADTSWASPVRPASGSPVRQQLAATPFADLPGPREVGVHLHWAVPDALARADSSGDFPPLPCRWLIVRLDGLAETGTPRRVTTWMFPNIHADPSTVIPGGEQQVQPIGAAPTPVTVRGRGADGPHPAWALSYDATVGRLGFHDPVSDPGVTGPLAYVVIGWFTHTRFDPLQPDPGTPATPTWFLDVLTDLGWSATLPTGAAAPVGSVYHGSAVGIGWPGTGWPGDGGGVLSAPGGGLPDPADVVSGLGDTLLSATAALLDGAASQPTTSASEIVLSGGERQLSLADGPARLDLARHQSRFVATASTDGMASAVYTEGAPAPGVAPATPAGQLTEVTYPTPRSWRPGDPVIALAGLGRTLRHGGDGRYDPAGLLDCRITGDTVSVTGASVLPALSLAADVPVEVGTLIAELAALDPGSVTGLDAAGPGGTSAQAAARAAWWAAWTTDWHAVPSGTGWQGVLPSPIALTPPSRPWNPLRIDWEAGWTATPTGPTHWQLGELDFEPVEPMPLAGLTSTALVGSGWLSASPADLVAAAVQRQDLSPSIEATYADAVAAGFEGFLDRIRGVPVGSWVGPRGIVDIPPQSVLDAEAYVADGHVAGVWSPTRLRVVDTFGQVLELLVAGGGPAPAPAVPEELQVGTGLALRPRFTAPTTLAARFLQPQPGGTLEAAPGLNPLAGLLLPSRIDLAAELVDVTGVSQGELRLDPVSSRTTLQETPSAGAGPSGVLAGLADLLTGADRLALQVDPDDSALAVLLDVVATTQAAVDVTARVGDSQLGLLLGNPIALVRLALRVDVDDPQGAAGNATALTPVRLGSIGLLTDGVLAWYDEADPTLLHPIHDAVAAEVAAASIAASSSPLLGDPLLWLTPGVTRTVVVLAVPGGDFTLVSGLVPQKQLELAREWTDPVLRVLTPTLGFDRVLHDPAAIALPVPGGVRGMWTWFHRTAPGRPWVGDALSADPPSAEPGTPVVVEDGYLTVTLLPDPPADTIDFEVTCVSRGPGGSIGWLGGTNDDGSPWRVPMSKAVEMVESGRFAFVVRGTADVEHTVPLQVGVSRRGRKYLHTPADDTTVNNLEELPRCP